MSISNMVSKAIGLTTIGLVGYETAKMSYRDTARNTIAESTNDLTDIFLKDQTSGYSGTVIEKIREGFKNHRLGSSLYETLNGVKNAVSSTITNIANSAVTIGLGVGALLTGAKNPNFIRKINVSLFRHVPNIRKQIKALVPSFGKICAALLVIQGLKTLIVDGLGFGQKSKL